MSEILKQYHVISWLTYRNYNSVWWTLSCIVTFFDKMVNKRDSENYWPVIKTMPERNYINLNRLFAIIVYFFSWAAIVYSQKLCYEKCYVLYRRGRVAQWESRKKKKKSMLLFQFYIQLVYKAPLSFTLRIKVNSAQEAWAKCFWVHVLKFEILKITWKNDAKNFRPLVFSFHQGNVH